MTEYEGRPSNLSAFLADSTQDSTTGGRPVKTGPARSGYRDSSSSAATVHSASVAHERLDRTCKRAVCDTFPQDVQGTAPAWTASSCGGSSSTDSRTCCSGCSS